jgi:hypothetical protein
MEPGAFSATTNQAIQEQCDIGWDLLLRGFPSKLWTKIQDRHYSTTTHTIEKASGQRWSSTLVSFLYWNSSSRIGGAVMENSKEIPRKKLHITPSKRYFSHARLAPSTRQRRNLSQDARLTTNWRLLVYRFSNHPIFHLSTTTSLPLYDALTLRHEDSNA